MTLVTFEQPWESRDAPGEGIELHPAQKALNSWRGVGVDQLSDDEKNPFCMTISPTKKDLPA